MHSLKRNQSGFAHLVGILAVVVILAIGGTGYYVMNNDKKSVNSEQSSSSDDSSSQATELGDLSGVMTVSEITALAGESLGANTINSIELESEDSGLVYKVKLSDKSVLVFDAKTGKQLTTSTVGSDDSFDNDDAVPANVATAIAIDAARATAVAEYPNVAVRKIELEMEEGILVFSVRFTDGARVDVNAATGAVVRTKASNNLEGSSSGSGSSSSGSGSSSGSSSSSGGSDDSSDDDSSSSSSSNTSGSAAAGTISESLARTIANNRLPGRTIEKVENETEEGVPVFSVRFTDDGRVDVRKSDGAITRVEE